MVFSSRVKKSDNLIVWTLCCIAVSFTLVAYIASSKAAGNGEILMPLDDAYIHFQYARQFTEGEPYRYNSGDPTSSGATSFIYPYLLATGYVLGFQNLDLGIWAMLVGATALLGSTWLTYKLAQLISVPGTPILIPILFTMAFALNGAITWHAMSGMETTLVVCFTLLTLYGFVEERFYILLMAMILLALVRPEGSIMALSAIAVTMLRNWYNRHNYAAPLTRYHWTWFILPLVAILLQPALNLLLTGSLSAAGSQAKSILSTVPFEWQDILERIATNFMNMWGEFATGTDGTYLPILIAPLALAGWLHLLVTPTYRWTALLLAIWFLSVSTAIATLDTAFWHFKRYQMPLFALLFPLAGWGTNVLYNWITTHFPTPVNRHLPGIVLTVLLLVPSVDTWREFLRLYSVNVENIAVQPLSMAYWLKANTSEDAIVAVHDVGMMRYVGERHTLDMVGLTTPGAADAWRNGPGAVAEFFMAYQPRADYVAAYTTARGLNYLADTDLYGDQLAGFSAEYEPADNVALGAEFQGIFQPDWSRVSNPTQRSLQQSTLERIGSEGVLVDFVNVANLPSESEHDYIWENTSGISGFVTEAYQFPYVGCLAQECTRIDGGRRINRVEHFTLRPQTTEKALLLVTRLHPAYRGHLEVYVNETYIDTQWIPQIPGYWLDIATLIPEHIVTDTLNIRIEPEMGNGFYMPYLHQAYQYADLQMEIPQDDIVASLQNGAITLHSLDTSNGTLMTTWYTDGSASGDYVLFFHIYDDIDQPPILQMDGYPGEGTLPPGNWLPGTLSDNRTIDTTSLDPGTYQAAIGFYDPVSFERLTPSYDRPNDGIFVDEDDRIRFVIEVN